MAKYNSFSFCFCLTSFSPPLTLRLWKNAEWDPSTLFAHGLSATGNDLPQTSPQKCNSGRISDVILIWLIECLLWMNVQKKPTASPLLLMTSGQRKCRRWSRRWMRWPPDVVVSKAIENQSYRWCWDSHPPHTDKVIKDAMGRDEAAKYPCETFMFSCDFMLDFDCSSQQKSFILLVSSLLVLKSGANAGDQTVAWEESVGDAETSREVRQQLKGLRRCRFRFP